jgi:transporter family-2 protein
MTAILLAALAGAAMAIQGAVNAVLGEKCGSFQASFIVHLGGASILFLLLLIMGSLGGVKDFRIAPWWSLLGAPLSVFIIWGVLSSVGEIGVSTATTAIIAAQILTALALDYFGITGHPKPFDLNRIIGAVLFAIGTYLLLRDNI